MCFFFTYVERLSLNERTQKVIKESFYFIEKAQLDHAGLFMRKLQTNPKLCSHYASYFLAVKNRISRSP